MADACNPEGVVIIPPKYDGGGSGGGCDCDFSDYYTKSEVDELLDGITSGDFIVVDELPETGEAKSIYLVPKSGGGYTEYVYINGAWEEIGDTDIDLSDYATKAEVNSAVEELNDAIDGKQDALTAGDNITIENGTISAKDTITTADVVILEGTQSGEPIVTEIDLKYSQYVSEEAVPPRNLLILKPGENVKLVPDGDKTVTINADTPDLSGYATTSALDAVEAKADTAQADATTALAMATALEETKQDILTAGDNITISGGVISATVPDVSGLATKEEVTDALATKQDKLTAGSHITIAEDGTISAECCTKDELLEILGYEEITISKTDADGNTITAHVLGYVEEPAETRGSLAIVNAKTNATADNIKLIADGVTVLDVSDVTFEYAGDESNPVYYFSPGFTTDASTLTVEITNLSADGAEGTSGTYTAYYDGASNNYMVEESVGLGDFLTIVTMFEGV